MGVSFPGKRRYEDVQFNVISVTRGWVGVKVPGTKGSVTLEWPHRERRRTTRAENRECDLRLGRGRDIRSRRCRS